MKPIRSFVPFTLLLVSIIPTHAEIVFVEATVQSIDRDARTFVIDAIESEGQRALEGPMEVRVSHGDAQLSYEGRRIRGELGQSDGRTLLEFIWPVEPDKQRIMDAVNLQLQMDTATRQRRQFRKEGDYGVNFSMFNEQGEIVQWNQFKGQWTILNFIFTRCRVQEMCPAQTARMIDLQRKAAAAGIEDLHLFSVTFDPDYDTPGILYDYAVTRGADLANFSFLTGPKPVMMNVLKQYGVIAFESANIIDHTVTTLLFDKTGKIVLRRDGTRWVEEEYIDHILEAQASASAAATALAGAPSNHASTSTAAPTVQAPDSSMRGVLIFAVLALLAIAAGVIFYSRKAQSTDPK